MTAPRKGQRAHKMYHNVTGWLMRHGVPMRPRDTGMVHGLARRADAAAAKRAR